MKSLGQYLLTLPLVLAFAIGLVHTTAARAATLDEYRDFALTHSGDSQRGQKLFNDEQRLGCSKCHSIDGHAGKAGPDLISAGDKFSRHEIVESVLRPSAIIAPGYGTTIVETKKDDVYQGILKQKTAAEIQLMGADGKLVSIKSSAIKEQRGTPISLMPEGLQAGLSLQEFTDLIEYLTHLQQPDSPFASNRGTPEEIPELAKPPVVTPFFTNEFTAQSWVQSGLTSLRQIPGASNTFLVLHQKGLIWKVEKTTTGENKTLFADLTGEVFSERGPNGLLDVAFHPQFRQNHKYYLFFQVLEDGTVTTHIVEKKFNANFTADSGEPARLILKIASVAEDHSGGCMQFGSDGFLYTVMGDTGPQTDPNGHAQNLQLLLGKMFRLDIDHQDAGLGYAIPKDNPFRNESGARPEIWAYGFRNPWRFSFDRVTGDIWLADVGQDTVEEVDMVQRGKNYGWNVYEGFDPFSTQYRKEGRTYTMPVFAYRRKYGASVTGGFVYRGDKNSSFYGVYICGDYVSRRLFGLTQDHGVLKAARLLGSIPEGLVSFSQDEAGNLYVIGYDGTIYKLDFTNARFE